MMMMMIFTWKEGTVIGFCVRLGVVILIVM